MLSAYDKANQISSTSTLSAYVIDRFCHDFASIKSVMTIIASEQRHSHVSPDYIWATSRKNLSSGVCDQVNLNPTCLVQKLARVLKIY